MAAPVPPPSSVTLRPAGDRIHLHGNRTVLSTGLDGCIRGGEQGLFVHETRMLSEYWYLVDDAEPRPAGVSPVNARESLAYYVAFPPGRQRPAADRGSGLLIEDTQQTVELMVRRELSTTGRGDVLDEHLTLTNYSDRDTAFVLTVVIDGDFLGLPELRNGPEHFGEVRQSWDAALCELRFDWTGSHDFDHGSEAGTAVDQRSLAVTVPETDGPVNRLTRGLAFPIHLAPRHRWTARLRFAASVPHAVARGPTRHATARLETTYQFPSDATAASAVSSVLRRAHADLIDLRLEDLDSGLHAWTIAAGIPIYVALFGRDTLTAGWQAATVTRDVMRGSLQALARLQGRARNDWRDEAAGRFLHEAHTGPGDVLNVTPRARYYGSVTTSGFFPLVLAEFWHWTADDELVRSLVPHALDGLRWLDESGDLDGDGFVEYLTRSSQGVKHQAWKDSEDAIVYPDGSQAEPPIATCEEQAFVYVAKLHLSQLLWSLGDRRDARRLLREARQLRKRFNAAFWLPDTGFLAMALDARKRPIASVASNAMHCLAAGIVRREYVRPTVDRLFQPDMFSGWGIRTLSSDHPGFNPYSYHRGTIWPVEQGSFALALMRYGLHEELARLARAVFDAAMIFEHARLPELFGGQPRDAEHAFPSLYPQANTPQAWSASTLFLIMQSLLGLHPYAPSRLLFLDPHLPEWLPEVVLRDLQVGDAVVTIRFRRMATGRTAYRVLDKRGHLHIIRQASPWSLTERVTRRVRDLAASALAGH